MKCDKDPVVEEVRKVRHKIFKECNYDPYIFGKFLAEREKKAGGSLKHTRKKNVVCSK